MRVNNERSSIRRIVGLSLKIGLVDVDRLYAQAAKDWVLVRRWGQPPVKRVDQHLCGIDRGLKFCQRI